MPDGSPWTNRPLGELNLRSRYNLLPMALKNAGGTSDSGQNFWVNPPDTILIKSGIVIIVMGDVGDIRRARGDAAGETAYTATAEV